MTDITIILINIMMGALGVLMTGLTILNAVSEVTPGRSTWTSSLFRPYGFEKMERSKNTLRGVMR
jgi:hypothetical protein